MPETTPIPALAEGVMNRGSRGVLGPEALNASEAAGECVGVCTAVILPAPRCDDAEL